MTKLLWQRFIRIQHSRNSDKTADRPEAAMVNAIQVNKLSLLEHQLYE
jgi:hypothetical protein